MFLHASLAGFLWHRQALHRSGLCGRRWGPLLTMVGGLQHLGLCSLNGSQDMQKELGDDYLAHYAYIYMYIWFFNQCIMYFSCVSKMPREGISFKHMRIIHVGWDNVPSISQATGTVSWSSQRTGSATLGNSMGQDQVVLNQGDMLCMQLYKSIPLLAICHAADMEIYTYTYIFIVGEIKDRYVCSFFVSWNIKNIGRPTEWCNLRHAGFPN